MSRPTNGYAVRPRLQIPCTNAQRALINDAAKRATSDPNAWALAQIMRAAAGHGGTGMFVVLSLAISSRVRQLSAMQDITPDQLIEQLLLGWESMP